METATLVAQLEYYGGHLTVNALGALVVLPPLVPLSLVDQASLTTLKRQIPQYRDALITYIRLRDSVTDYDETGLDPGAAHAADAA